MQFSESQIYKNSDGKNKFSSSSKIIFLLNQQVNCAEQLERFNFTKPAEALVVF